jgi:hypothetical protein
MKLRCMDPWLNTCREKFKYPRLEVEIFTPLPPGGNKAPALAALASLATPAFKAAFMALQAECMQDYGSFGAWLRPLCVFTFTFTAYSVLWFV